MEKPPSPTTELANQRLKRSFEKVKAQVDVDLLHLKKEIRLLLHKDTGTAAGEHGVLPRCSTELFIDMSLLLQMAGVHDESRRLIVHGLISFCE